MSLRQPPSLAAALALALTVLLTPPSARAADPPPPEAYDGGIFDFQARIGFWINRQIFSVINTVGDWVQSGPKTEESARPVPPQTAFGRGVSNVAANLVNEPITAVTNLAMGDVSTAWVATKRFAINSTVGLFGWYDVAKDWGLKPTVTDVGLILCAAGVGEWSYVVLPFVGPRTVRDGLADVVLTNLILWSMVGVTLGTGASLRTILIAEAIEVGADLLATRQIDPNAKVVHYNDFDAVRAAYLEQRRARCAALRKEKEEAAAEK